LVSGALGGSGAPSQEQVDQAAQQLIDEAVKPFAAKPELRRTLIEIQERSEQTIDAVSHDVLLEAGFSETDTERARATVATFREFIEQYRDEIAALSVIYSRPYGQQRLTFAQVKELAQQLEQPPHSWTTEGLWRAYAQLERDKVRDAGGKRVLTDVVVLVRHAAGLDDAELVPYPQRVRERYVEWLAAQEGAGKVFTPEQRWWLDRIAEQVGVNCSVSPEDLDYGEFYQRGGRLGLKRQFGQEWASLLSDVNAALVA
jgi:type I restriction enzyme R subunit